MTKMAAKWLKLIPYLPHTPTQFVWEYPPGKYNNRSLALFSFWNWIGRRNIIYENGSKRSPYAFPSEHILSIPCHGYHLDWSWNVHFSKCVHCTTVSFLKVLVTQLIERINIAKSEKTPRYYYICTELFTRLYWSSIQWIKGKLCL